MQRSWKTEASKADLEASPGLLEPYQDETEPHYCLGLLLVQPGKQQCTLARCLPHDVP